MKKIRLIIDLPIDRKYGCFAGEEYVVVKVHTEKNSNRIRKVEFALATSETACVLPHEFEWVI